MGGPDRDSAEIYSHKDNVWRTVTGKLPAGMVGIRAMNIDNRILLFGNYLDPLSF